MIELIAAPRGTNMSGQCCISMASGVNLLNIEKRMGRGLIRTNDLIIALKVYNIDCDIGLRKVRPHWRDRLIESKHNAIVRISWLNWWQWALFYQDQIYDPINREICTVFKRNPSSYLIIFTSELPVNNLGA